MKEVRVTESRGLASRLRVLRTQRVRIFQEVSSLHRDHVLQAVPPFRLHVPADTRSDLGGFDVRSALAVPHALLRRERTVAQPHAVTRQADEVLAHV